MPRRFYLRTTLSDATGFATGESKSFAMDQALNNQPVGTLTPVAFYGGELAPMTLSPERGEFDTGTSLTVNPPDSTYSPYDLSNTRGFLTHFITPPEKEQHLRAGFTRIALKGIHAAVGSSVQLEASIYIVDATGAVVSFLWDKDKAISPALVQDPTTAGVVLMCQVPTRPGDIPAQGRVVVELWTRQLLDELYGDTDGVGAEIFLEGSDDSFGPTVGGTGAYDTDSVASYVEFPQVLELADEEPVFAVRIDPLTGMKHSRIWSTDVLERDNQSEQRARIRKIPNHVAEFVGVGHGEDEMQLMDALIEKLSDRAVWLPWWRDEQTLPSTLAMGATTLSVATASYSFRAGRRAIIWQTPFVWEVVTIDTVNDGSLLITAGLSREWIAGTASIMPLKDAVMLGALRIDRQATNHGAAELAFTLTPEETRAEGTGLPEGEIGDCLTPNSTTTAASSGLSLTKMRGDDFSAWGLEDYQAFLDDSTENPNYEDGVRGPPYSKIIPSNLPAYFWEFFDDVNASYPYTPPGDQVNRNRISQLAVNGGHRTVKAIKTADDLPSLFNGFEIWPQDKIGDPTVRTSFWGRLRCQYSANFPFGQPSTLGDGDANQGVYVINVERIAGGEIDVAVIATGDGTDGLNADTLTITHRSSPAPISPLAFRQSLGSAATVLATGTPREFVLYAGDIFDPDTGLVISGFYRVAVWMGDAFGTLTKMYDQTKECSHRFGINRCYMMRSKGAYSVPEGQGVICYECIEWEIENGGAGLNPYGVPDL